MGRYSRLREIESMDPATEHHAIYHLTSSLEFPWDTQQALSFALFRTYAVPSIGRLLAETGELPDRPQKRYDDTVLLLDAVAANGIDSDEGRTAVRRINQMHNAYDISNEDMLYVLATFVVVPIRWIDSYGWRRISATERAAAANYYRELGRHMAIKDIPSTYEAFAQLLDRYERQHFGFDPGGRAVADSTMNLAASFPANRRLPRSVFTGFLTALMDEPLREAFGYPRPPRVQRAAARGGLWLRGRLVRLLPPRTVALRARDLPEICSYPGGYRVSELGTFPARCPVPRKPETASAEKVSAEKVSR